MGILNNKLTPASFIAKSDKITGVFKTTIDALTVENEKALSHVGENKKAIEELHQENVIIEEVVAKNSNFTSKLNELFK